MRYEEHLGNGCALCDAAPLQVVFVICGSGYPPGDPKHHIGYEHRLVTRCPACGAVQLEVYDHDCFDHGAIFDQYDEWFVIDGARCLLRFLDGCPTPLDRDCKCPRHRTMRRATRHLQRRPWSVALEHYAHMQRVRVHTDSGEPVFDDPRPLAIGRTARLLDAALRGGRVGLAVGVLPAILTLVLWFRSGEVSQLWLVPLVLAVAAIGGGAVGAGRVALVRAGRRDRA